MLTVGLTGGIGAGKSAVASRLVECGAVLVDSDALAREVVAAGSVGLSRVVEAFGRDILDETDALDRAKLAARVFDDAAARRQLESIVHPLVRAAADERIAAAGDEAIVVNDVPLLAEVGLAPTFDLVIVVEAPQDVRLARLEKRGLPPEQARSRIAAQTQASRRRAVADVVIDNSGALPRLQERVDSLWRDRLVPFAAAKRAGAAAALPWPPQPRPWDPDWPRRFARLEARLGYVLGETATAVDHVGATAVENLAGRDILDVAVTAVDTVAVAQVLRSAGFFPRQDDPVTDVPVYGGADPANLSRVLVVSSEVAAEGLARRALLRRDAASRRAYEAVRREAASGSPRTYQEAKQRWWRAARP